jgi:hypothetical protein
MKLIFLPSTDFQQPYILCLLILADSKRICISWNIFLNNNTEKLLVEWLKILFAAIICFDNTRPQSGLGSTFPPEACTLGLPFDPMFIVRYWSADWDDAEHYVCRILFSSSELYFTTYNVILRGVRVTIVAAERECKLHVYVCGCPAAGHVAIFIQHAWRMRHIVTLFVPPPPPAPSHFPTLSHKPFS